MIFSLLDFFPQTKVDCTDPGSPANGMAVGNDYNHDAEVSFTCNTNFTLVGVAMMRCNNGSWSSNVPTCNGKSKDSYVTKITNEFEF